MPYARRRKTGVAKRRYARKATPTVSKATKRYVKTALKANKENNWFDIYEPDSVEMNYDNITNTALFAPPQGDTIATREGDRIEPVRLYGCYNIQFPSASLVARVIIFQWKPDNGVDAPSLAKILEDTSAYSTTANYVGSAVDRKKFKILHDKVIPNPTGVTNQIVVKKFNISKFNSKFITFDTATTNGKGQVYVYLLSNIAVAGSGPVLSGHFRSVWKDTA